MANNLDDVGDVLDHTLDEYLLGLARGIADAQKALNQLAVPGGDGGQAAVAYHMPSLEFELRLHMTMQGSSGTGAAANRQLRFRPASGSSGGDSYSIDAVSTISGSFVSVPLASGRPSPRLHTTMTVQGGGQVLLTASVTDPLGKPLPNVDVNFNLDRERTASMNSALNPKFALNAATGLKAALVRTDDQGQAQSLLQIAAAEPASAMIVLIVDIAGASETLLVPVLTGKTNVTDR